MCAAYGSDDVCNLCSKLQFWSGPHLQHVQLDHEGVGTRVGLHGSRSQGAHDLLSGLMKTGFEGLCLPIQP